MITPCVVVHLFGYFGNDFHRGFIKKHSFDVESLSDEIFIIQRFRPIHWSLSDISSYFGLFLFFSFFCKEFCFLNICI